MRRISTKLGELNCQIVEALPEGTPPKSAVVLCHGFGAPANDLVDLAPALLQLQPELAATTRFVFPAAPLSLAEYGAPSGRAWWHLPQSLLMGGTRNWERYLEEVPEGLPAARRALMSLVTQLSDTTKLPLNRIVLGGFSQGAMLATDVALRLEEAPAGLAILSGALIARPEWTQRAARRKGLPVFQTHGTEDSVLPYVVAEQLHALLQEAGLKVEFLPFRGPHTIAPEALVRLSQFLVAQSSEPRASSNL